MIGILLLTVQVAMITLAALVIVSSPTMNTITIAMVLTGKGIYLIETLVLWSLTNHVSFVGYSLPNPPSHALQMPSSVNEYTHHRGWCQQAWCVKHGYFVEGCICKRPIPPSPTLVATPIYSWPVHLPNYIRRVLFLQFSKCVLRSTSGAGKKHR